MRGNSLSIACVIPTILVVAMAGLARAAENLRLAASLSFVDDSSAAFPIAGDHLQDATPEKGRAAIAFFGAAHCWNTNREAERLVALYPKYRDRVSFIVVDVNHPSAAQRILMQQHYKGYIPTVVVFAADGAVIYARSGETAEKRGDASALDDLLARSLQR